MMPEQETCASPAVPEAFSVRRCTTDTLAERDRLAMWREEFGRSSSG